MSDPISSNDLLNFRLFMPPTLQINNTDEEDGSSFDVQDETSASSYESYMESSDWQIVYDALDALDNLITSGDSVVYTEENSYDYSALGSELQKSDLGEALKNSTLTVVLNEDGLYILQYDEDGKDITKIYDENGVLKASQSIEITENDDGTKLEETKTAFYENDKITMSTNETVEYDTEGSVVKKEVSNYSYDENGVSEIQSHATTWENPSELVLSVTKLDDYENDVSSFIIKTQAGEIALNLDENCQAYVTCDGVRVEYSDDISSIITSVSDIEGLSEYFSGAETTSDNTATSTDTTDSTATSTTSDSTATSTDTAATTSNSTAIDGTTSSSTTTSTVSESDNETTDTENVQDWSFIENSGVKDKIEQDDDGYYITVETWSSSNSSDALDCVSRIIKNVYGVSYYSEEGQAIFEALAEANPNTLDVNNPDLVRANVRINLVDISTLSVSSENTESLENSESSEEYSNEELSSMYATTKEILEAGVPDESNNTLDIDQDGVNESGTIDIDGDGTADYSYINYTTEEGNIVLYDVDGNGTLEDSNDVAAYYTAGAITDVAYISGKAVLATENSLDEAYHNTADFEGKNILLVDNDSDGTYESAVEFDENNNILQKYILNITTNSYEAASDKEDDEEETAKVETSTSGKTSESEEKTTSNSTESDEEENSETVEDALTQALNMSVEEIESIIGDISAITDTLHNSNGSYAPSELREIYYKYVTALYAAAQKGIAETSDNYQIEYDDDSISKITLGYTDESGYHAMVEYSANDTSSIIVHDSQVRDTARDKKVVFNSDGTVDYYVTDEDGDGDFDD